LATTSSEPLAVVLNKERFVKAIVVDDHGWRQADHARVDTGLPTSGGAGPHVYLERALTLITDAHGCLQYCASTTARRK
jgi:hypothetical protein